MIDVEFSRRGRTSRTLKSHQLKAANEMNAFEKFIVLTLSSRFRGSTADMPEKLLRYISEKKVTASKLLLPQILICAKHVSHCTYMLVVLCG